MKVVLKQYLKKRDISLAKLCRMTGLCYKTVNMWSLGHTKHLLGETVDKICYALGCNMNDIIQPETPQNHKEIKRIIES